MAEIKQFSSWEDGSNSRIIDMINGSKAPPAPSANSLDDLKPYSAIEFGYYTHLSAANDLPQFEEKIEESIRDLGFKEFSYFRTDGGAADSERLATVSKDLLKDYFAERLFEHDLILPYADSNTAPLYQSTLHDYAKNAPFDIDMTRMMRAIGELNKSHGYHEFYNTLAKAKSGSGNVVLSVTIKGCSPVELKRIVEVLNRLYSFCVKPLIL